MSDQLLRPPEGTELLGDVLELADWLVDEITDAQVEDNLRQLLDHQDDDGQLPATIAPVLYLVSSERPEPDAPTTADPEDGQVGPEAASSTSRPTIHRAPYLGQKYGWLIAVAAAVAAFFAGAIAVNPGPSSPSTLSSLPPVPRLPYVLTGPHAARTSLPNALLFTSGSAQLLPSVNGILQPIVQRARIHNERITITGYASPDGGTPAYNRTLSEQRAQAVRNRLIALGLPADRITRVTGAGTGGMTRSACLVDGQLVEAICAKFRRVVITLSPDRG